MLKSWIIFNSQYFCNIQSYFVKFKFKMTRRISCYNVLFLLRNSLYFSYTKCSFLKIQDLSTSIFKDTPFISFQKQILLIFLNNQLNNLEHSNLVSNQKDILKRYLWRHLCFLTSTYHLVLKAISNVTRKLQVRRKSQTNMNQRALSRKYILLAIPHYFSVLLLQQRSKVLPTKNLQTGGNYCTSCMTFVYTQNIKKVNRNANNQIKCHNFNEN